MCLLSNFLTYFLHIVNAFLTNYGLTYVQNKANTTAGVQSTTTPARATIRWIALPSPCIVGAGPGPPPKKKKKGKHLWQMLHATRRSTQKFYYARAWPAPFRR